MSAVQLETHRKRDSTTNKERYRRFRFELLQILAWLQVLS